MKVISPSIFKLVKHPEICSGILHPITAQINLTNGCNLSCGFCSSQKHRENKKTLTFNDVERCLKFLKNNGCKSIQYTGGGEPTLHKRFNDIISLTKAFGFLIGLTTNGTRLVECSPVLSDFEWIRVSINAGPQDYEKVHGKALYNKIMDGLNLIDKSGTPFGISFVLFEQYNLNSMVDLLTDLNGEKFNNLRYVRVAHDINSTQPSEFYADIVRDVCDNILESSIFVDIQLNRDTRVPEKCVMHRLKPAIDCDGNIYPCCTAQRKQEMCLGHFSEYEYFKKDLDTALCDYCTYAAINDFAVGVEQTDVVDPEFI